MAQSFVQYSADGRDYSVPFAYINKAHVTATLSGAAVSLEWLSSNLVRLPAEPPTGAVIEIKRTTPSEERLVDFVDGSTLGESDLDLSALQLLFVAQEAFDKSARALGLTAAGTFEGRGLELVNIAAPTLPTSAANKAFVEATAQAAADEVAGKTTFLFVEADTSLFPSKYFKHTQTSPSAEWSVQHNLNGYPKPTVYDSDGKFVIAEFFPIDLNSLRITFGAPISGIAYIS